MGPPCVCHDRALAAATAWSVGIAAVSNLWAKRLYHHHRPH